MAMMHLHMMSLTPYKYQLYGSYRNKIKKNKVKKNTPSALLEHCLATNNPLFSGQHHHDYPLPRTSVVRCQQDHHHQHLSHDQVLPLLLLILHLHVIHASNVKINSHYWHVKRKPPLGRLSGGKRWVGPRSTCIKNRLIWPFVGPIKQVGLGLS